MHFLGHFELFLADFIWLLALIMVLIGGKTGIWSFVMFWPSSGFKIVDVDRRFTVQEVFIRSFNLFGQFYVDVWKIILRVCRYLTVLMEDLFDISLYLAEQWGLLVKFVKFCACGMIFNIYCFGCGSGLNGVRCFISRIPTFSSLFIDRFYDWF